MAGAHNSLTWTGSDDIAAALSAESCHIVLESSPPDYVEKISRYLESSEGHNRQNEVADEPAEAESDSGDSLFITQISAPEAERTRRRHRSPRSQPVSPRAIEGSGSDTSSSDSHEVSKNVQRRRRKKKPVLPKYRFSFLSGRKWKPNTSLLSRQQNTSLHNCMMGGFFRRVREQWLLSFESQDGKESPTVDVDGEYISPLSEEEKEGLEDEDIKVVERKCLLAPSKGKSQQSWNSPLKQDKNTRKRGNAGQETSQGRRHKRDLVEKFENGEKGASGENTQRCLPRGDEISLQQKAGEEEMDKDSDAAVCEPHNKHRSPRLCPQKKGDASATATEPRTDVLMDTSQTENEHDSPDLFESLPNLLSDTNNDSGARGKKDNEGHDESIEEEEKGHNQEEPEGLRTAKPASQTSDELEFNERNCLESSLHGNSIVRQEEESDVRVEDSGFSDSCNAENGGKRKKKKKRKMSDEEQLQARADAELLSDDAEIKKKRKKEEKTVIAEECEEEKESNTTLDLPPRSTGHSEELGDGLEDAALESSYVKGKSPKKKKPSPSDDATQDREEVVDVSFSNNAVTLEQSADMSLKKKKKKKKKTTSEEVDVSHTPEENEKVECEDNAHQAEEGLEADAELATKKKKKKKNKNKTTSEEVGSSHTPEENEKVECEDNAHLTEEGIEADAELATKKKKKKKKTISEEVGSSRTPEENEKVECEDNAHQTEEGIEADAELATKKKKKKKKKTNSEEVDVSHTPEETETAEDNTKKIKEGPKDQNDEKKKSELFGKNMSEDKVVQSDDSVSVRKREKKKKRTSSFLAADAVENGVQTHGEQSCLDLETESAGNLEESINGVRKKKKKRKRKVSEEQDGVEKDHEQDFEEANETHQHALPESADTGVKMKKRKKKNKDEACSVIQESPPTASNDIKEKKRTKPTDESLLEGHSEIQLQESKKKKKKDRNKQSAVPNIVFSSPALSETSVRTSETSFSGSIVKSKQKKIKRTLHYPSEDFLTDY